MACSTSNTGWKNADHWDPPRPGAEAFLTGLVERGFDVVVFTTRHPAQVRSKWLREHNLLPLISGVTRRKPPAHVFVDDRAVRWIANAFVAAVRQHGASCGYNERAG